MNRLVINRVWMLTRTIDRRKRIIDLSKKAAFTANKHGSEGRRTWVVLDITASMNVLYKTGIVQRVIERIPGLASAAVRLQQRLSIAR